MDTGSQTIVRGIELNARGEATVDAALADVIFDLALQLEERLKLPVDVQHVVAGVVLAGRAGELPQDTQLSAGDSNLLALLETHVQIVFQQHGGQVGGEDS